MPALKTLGQLYQGTGTEVPPTAPKILAFANGDVWRQHDIDAKKKEPRDVLYICIHMLGVDL